MGKEKIRVTFPEEAGFSGGWAAGKAQWAAGRPRGEGSGWGFATPKRMLLISQEMVSRKAWSSLVHSAALNNLPVNCFFLPFDVRTWRVEIIWGISCL